MENASKALIMAAEILIGVMIISIGVYIFNEMGTYSAETTAQMEEAQLAQYNNQFLKYYGNEREDDTGKTVPIKCTIHEIIGVANLAKKINAQNRFEGVQTPSDTSDYIQIELSPKYDSGVQSKVLKNLETASDSDLISIVKTNDIQTSTVSPYDPETVYFKVETVGIGEVNRTVNYMKFVPYN